MTCHLRACHVRPDAAVFFFNDTATTEIYTLSLHDALPISALGHVAHSAGDRGYARAEDHRDDHDVLDHEVVRLDEECRAFDGIHLGLGGLPCPVVLLVAPARDVAALPLVLALAQRDRKSTRLNSSH